jgi:hypothetical protein
VAITIVAYNGIQARASDARMRSVANQLKDAVLLWNNNSGVAPKGGWSSAIAFNGTNCSDGTGGWVASGFYTCSLEDILLEGSLIPQNLISGAPKNKNYGTQSDGRRSFMIYPCSGTDRLALYWYLESPSSDDTSNLSSIEASGCPTSPRATYGMRAATIMQF